MLGYFFIGGAPKSGTTWLQRTLDLHPQIVCSGEGHMHEFVVRPIAEMVSRYNDKLGVVAEAVYEGRPYCPPVSRQEQIEITRAVMTMLMARRTKPGARLVGDKTPANAKIVDDLAVLFPGMKFIMVLRDPRDVAASRLGQARRTGFAEADDRSSEVYRKIVRGAGWDWRVMLERAQAFARRCPDQISTVRYEDLVRRPADELLRLFEFLGAETTVEQLARIVEDSRFEAFSGGRKPGDEDQRSFYRKGVAGDWPNHLSAEALEILLAECGEAMQGAGYDPDPPHAEPEAGLAQGRAAA